MPEEREDDCRIQVSKHEARDWPTFLSRDKAQEQSPSVPIGQHRMMREVVLLSHPFMEEGV
jgi:hypothetical protein